MIEGFEPSSLVIVNLVNPKEKFFGILEALSPAGVTLRGINLDAYEDWIRQIAHREEADLDVATMSFDDAEHLREAQPTAACALGRKERLEDSGFRLGSHSGARIGHLDAHLVFQMASSQ